VSPVEQLVMGWPAPAPTMWTLTAVLPADPCPTPEQRREVEAAMRAHLDAAGPRMPIERTVCTWFVDVDAGNGRTERLSYGVALRRRPGASGTDDDAYHLGYGAIRCVVVLDAREVDSWHDPLVEVEQLAAQLNRGEVRR
jgi:hypothetical protein